METCSRAEFFNLIFNNFSSSVSLFLSLLLALSMDFVLSVFSLTRLFAHQLSSCCKLVFKLDLNVWMLDMGAEEFIEVPFAKISTVVFCPITPTGRSLMKIRKRRGASTEPWGTP